MRTDKEYRERLCARCETEPGVCVSVAVQAGGGVGGVSADRQDPTNKACSPPLQGPDHAKSDRAHWHHYFIH